MARNILGSELIDCSIDPMTGFYRNGKCDTCGDDAGRHSICAQMTDSFLEFSASCGNDLITPMPDYKFPGLKAGDFWCICLGRWIEAHEAGVAPKIKGEVVIILDHALMSSYESSMAVVSHYKLAT
ncbi:MAG: DUF2237 domain-containing protein, partial [Verrucomicrobiota bacterium]|nr:DUF2237 domain-containing protein [Verrucomicrobiota bacterium]MEC7235456.1 DUF2237 domain-containing protein [Verrucomicrobiota bacterium]